MTRIVAVGPADTKLIVLSIKIGRRRHGPILIVPASSDANYSVHYEYILYLSAGIRVSRATMSA